MRKEILLNGNWLFYKNCTCPDGLKAVEAEEITIPHTWNNIDGQDGGNDYFRGTCCYRKVFQAPSLDKDQQLYIEFSAVNASAAVYLNGKLIKTHDGGYSAFQVRIDEYLREENELLVFADNSVNDRVYPQNADFTFYGGIYRDVHLIIVSSSHFGFGSHGGHGVRITPVVEGRNGILKADSWISGEYDKVVFSVLDKDKLICSFEGPSGSASIENVHLWDGLKDPFLYTVRSELVLKGKVVDDLEYEIGFRVFEFNPDKGFILNGRSYPLRGVSRHQDREGAGNAITKEMHEEDLSLILECGANSIRLAHYQHDQYFYDLCDRAGVICWAEIPYITKHMENGVDNTLSQMAELIEQCYNHSCIACWSISNEITAGGNSDEVYENNRKLYELCHGMDQNRPVAMAHAFMLPIDDRIVTLPDIAGYNLYYGWYLGTMDGNGDFLDSCHRKHPNLPLALTEFGCDANLAFQTSNPVKSDYTEQYQAQFHEFMCKEIDKRPYLWGTYIWNMFDFAADARDEGGSKGRNCKGLVTFDRKTKKDSFYIIKAWYSKEPFVHICSKRYVNRAEQETEVRIYSNREEIELFVNNKSIGKKRSSHVFIFRVQLEKGQNSIEAVSGGLRDKCMINRVDEPDKSYVFTASEEISNWFEGLNLNVRQGYLSVHDTVGNIIKTAEGRAVVDDVLEAREGNSAEGVSSQIEMTEYMIQMTMKDVPLSELLRRAKFQDSYIREINSRLNQIECRGT